MVPTVEVVVENAVVATLEFSAGIVTLAVYINVAYNNRSILITIPSFKVYFLQIEITTWIA